MLLVFVFVKYIDGFDTTVGTELTIAISTIDSFSDSVLDSNST